MDLRTHLSEDLKIAMKERDKLRMSTLRLVQSEIKKADIALKTAGKGDAIGETAILALMHKMIKQRQESAKIYSDNARESAAEAERAEIEIIDAYLPQLKSESDTKILVEAKVIELKAQGMQDMGRVVAAMKADHPGELDMALTSQLIKTCLSLQT